MRAPIEHVPATGGRHDDVAGPRRRAGQLSVTCIRRGTARRSSRGAQLVSLLVERKRAHGPARVDCPSSKRAGTPSAQDPFRAQPHRSSTGRRTSARKAKSAMVCLVCVLRIWIGRRRATTGPHPHVSEFLAVIALRQTSMSHRSSSMSVARALSQRYLLSVPAHPNGRASSYLVLRPDERGCRRLSE